MPKHPIKIAHPSNANEGNRLRVVSSDGSEFVCWVLRIRKDTHSGRGAEVRYETDGSQGVLWDTDWTDDEVFVIP